MFTLRQAAAPLMLLSLAACAGGVAPQTRVASPSAQVRAAVPDAATYRRAARLRLPGLEGVVGATAPGLLRAFGPPRLDVREGDARKLQFAGGACILDVYLYPPLPGREPEADYVDARLPDGRDVDRAGCVAALRRP